MHISLDNIVFNFSVLKFDINSVIVFVLSCNLLLLFNITCLRFVHIDSFICSNLFSLPVQYSIVCVCVCVSLYIYKIYWSGQKVHSDGNPPDSSLYPWNSPIKNSGVGSHSLLQGICWSFNGPEPGGPESKREKGADIPWFTRKANSRKTPGPKLCWSKDVLINMAWAHILQLFSAKMRIKIPDLQNTR